MSYKIITSLSVLLFLANVMVIAVHVNALESGEIKMIDLIANGEDINNPATEQFIMTKIIYNETNELYLAHMEFHIKYYDESGEKYYSIKGKLKDGAVMRIDYWDPNNYVYWENALWVFGEGEVKTTETSNYVPTTVGMLASTSGVFYYYLGGEKVYGYSGIGPWAWAGIWVGPGQNVGVTTIITKYMEKTVP